MNDREFRRAKGKVSILTMKMSAASATSTVAMEQARLFRSTGEMGAASHFAKVARSKNQESMRLRVKMLQMIREPMPEGRRGAP